MIVGGEIGLLDTSALVALLSQDDEGHEAVVEYLQAFRGRLMTTEAVLTEGLHLLRPFHGGADACLTFFLRGAAVLVPSTIDSLRRCRDIMVRYSDLPADYADATLIALSEEVGSRTVVTLDRRDFSVYRDRAGKSFEIRP